MKLNNALGCMCELKTMDNAFLGLGRISAYSSTDNSIDIVSCDGGHMPSMRYATKVKINVFGSKHGFLGLEGFVYIAHDSFWRLYDISSLGDNERRSYFRIKIRSHAEVEELFEGNQTEADGLAPVDQGLTRRPCLVISVSLSGVLIAIDDDNCNYRIGSILQIHNFYIGEINQMFILKCRVKRMDYHERLGRLLGCEFADLDDKTIERLCQTIFAQQRLEIHRKRGMH